MNNEKTKLTLTYDGAGFHGWQVQKDKVTVQATLQDAIEAVCKKRLPVTGCSRTDAGVHAYEFVCHTDKIDIPCDKIPAALNAHLPETVSVKKAQTVPEDFHARYSCLGKEYVYMISNAPYRDPFLNGRVMFCPKKLDEGVMHSSMQALVGRHDFKSFMAQGSKIEDTVREIKYLRVTRKDDTVCLHVAADGFLYNMVRILTGTLIEVGRGMRKPEEMKMIIEAQDRGAAGFTAPAQGLYLVEVEYSH